MAAEAPEELQPWSPPQADWMLVHELIQIGNDRLGQIASLLADLPIGVTHRHSFPPPLPRPAPTALEKAMARVRAEREDAYDDRIDQFVSEAKQRWREEQARAVGDQQSQG